MSDTTMPELIASLNRRVIKDGARIAELKARAEQAEAALDSFLGPDGGKTVVELRAELAKFKSRHTGGGCGKGVMVGGWAP